MTNILDDRMAPLHSTLDHTGVRSTTPGAKEYHGRI